MDRTKNSKFSSNAFFSEMGSCSFYHADKRLSVIWGFICCLMFENLGETLWLTDETCLWLFRNSRPPGHYCGHKMAALVSRIFRLTLPLLSQKVKLLFHRERQSQHEARSEHRRHFIYCRLATTLSVVEGAAFFFNTEALAECRGSARGNQQTGQTEKERVNV